MSFFSKNSKNVENYNKFLDKFGNYGSFNYNELYSILFPDNDDAKQRVGETTFKNLAKLPKNIDEYTTDDITSFEDLYKKTGKNSLGKNDDIFKQINLRTSKNELNPGNTDKQQLFEDVKKFLKKPGMISMLRKKFTKTNAGTGGEIQPAGAAGTGGEIQPAGAEGETEGEIGNRAGAGAGEGVQNYLGGRKSRRRNKKTRKSRKRQKRTRANKK